MNAAVYTVDEVARLLAVSRQTIYREIADNKIPSLTLRRRVVVPRVWVDRRLNPQ